MDWRRLARFDALALTAAIWFLAKFLRYAFPPLFNTLQVAYDVSNTVLGLLFTGLMLSYALLQFPSGALGDRVGMVRVITAGALVAAGAAFLLVLSDLFAVLVVGMVFVGVGTGAHKTVAINLMSAVYPERTGRALGTMDTVGAFGGVAAPAAVVAATDTVGWRSLFLGAAVAGVALAGLFALRVPRRLRGPPGSEVGSDTGATGDGHAGEDADADGRDDADGESESPPASTDGGEAGYATLFAQPQFVAFVGVTVLFSFAYNGVVAFLPLYLTEQAGLTEAVAGLLYSALFLVSVVQAVTGELSDRMGRLPVIAATMGLATVSLALVVAGSGSGAVVLGTAVVALGLGSHGFRPVRDAYLVTVIPDAVAGGTLGIVRTILMGAGAVAPAVVGFLSDTAGFAAAFGLLAASMGAGTLLVGVLARQSDPMGGG